MTDLLQYGAVGDGKTLCTESFRRAVRAAKERGGAVNLPASVFLTGTIDLQGVSLHLESGAVIKGSPDPAGYPVLPYRHNELGDLQALIVCLGGKNVSLTGEGVIDINGSSFFDFSRPIIPNSRVPFRESQIKECTVEREWRPTQSIFFHQMENLTLRGITVLDAPCWTITFSECANIKALGLTIDTNLNVPNDDGMHFCGCNGVVVSDCRISSGDDCIAISGITNWTKPCENIVITNCVLRSCSKALVMGYIYSHVRNVLIENVIIQESNRGLYFMCDTQGGLVENVRVKNMLIDTRVRAGNWWGNGEAVFFMAMKHDYTIPPEQNPHRETPVNYRSIVLEGITCQSENAIGAVGTQPHAYEEVTLRDITVARKPSANLPLKGNTFDVAPAPDVVEAAYAYGKIDSPLGGLTTDQWCERYRVRRAGSIEELLEKCDCVNVLSPDNPEMHPELCQLLPLKSGKRVYVDKTFSETRAGAPLPVFPPSNRAHPLPDGA